MKGEGECPGYPFFSLVGLEINPETLPPPIVLCIVIIWSVCSWGVCVHVCAQRG